MHVVTMRLVIFIIVDFVCQNYGNHLGFIFIDLLTGKKSYLCLTKNDHPYN